LAVTILEMGRSCNQHDWCCGGRAWNGSWIDFKVASNDRGLLGISIHDVLLPKRDRADPWSFSLRCLPLNLVIDSSMARAFEMTISSSFWYR
jgi:hypothetical protein